MDPLTLVSQLATLAIGTQRGVTTVFQWHLAVISGLQYSLKPRCDIWLRARHLLHPPKRRKVLVKSLASSGEAGQGPCLRTFWKRSGTFSKTTQTCRNRKPETNTGAASSPRGVCLGNKSNAVRKKKKTKRTAFCTVSREVVRSIISGLSWRSGAHTHTHIHTHSAAR